MQQRHMASIPEWAWAYCLKEGARENLRASAVLNQIVRLGLEAREASKAEAAKAQRIISELRAIA